MRGTFCRMTGCSVSSAAAMIGSAAFLFPDGWIVPDRRFPPWTTNCSAFMYDLAMDERRIADNNQIIWRGKPMGRARRVQSYQHGARRQPERQRRLVALTPRPRLRLRLASALHVSVASACTSLVHHPAPRRSHHDLVRL